MLSQTRKALISIEYSSRIPNKIKELSAKKVKSVVKSELI